MKQNIKCDNPKCDYIEDIEELVESLINKPCPKCNENLLTEEDFNDAIELIKTLEILGSFKKEELEEMGYETLDEPLKVTVSTHKGNINIIENHD